MQEQLLYDLARQLQTFGDAEVLIEQDDHDRVVLAIADRTEVRALPGARTAHGLDLDAFAVLRLDVPTGLTEGAALAAVMLGHDRFRDVTHWVVVRPDDPVLA